VGVLLAEAVEKYKEERGSEQVVSTARAHGEARDCGPVRGTFAIRPYGFAIWERIQATPTPASRPRGTRTLTSALIPESYLKREAEVVEAFDPELAWVTVGGRGGTEDRRPSDLGERNLRLKQLVQSYRDSPVLINQWCNVMREA